MPTTSPTPPFGGLAFVPHTPSPRDVAQTAGAPRVRRRWLAPMWLGALAALLGLSGALACKSDPPLVEPQRIETTASDEQLEFARLAQSPTPGDASRLIEGLEADDDLVRLYAVRGLALLAPSAALPILYDLSLNDPSPRIAREAERALRSYPAADVQNVEVRRDPIQRARTEARDRRQHERLARNERQMARLTPPFDLETMEELASLDHPDVGFFVTDVELVRDHAPPGHPMGYNGRANAGELLEYAVTIANASTTARMSSSAYAYTYDPYATIINRELPVPTMQPNEEATLERTLLVLISPDAPERHTLRIFLEVGDSRLNALNDGRPVYRPLGEIEVENVGFGPVRFELEDLVDDVWGHSDGNGNGIAEWGETVELRLGVRNLGSYALREARLRLSSPSRLVDIRTPPAAQAEGDVPPGGRPGFSRTFAAALSHGYEGAFAVPLVAELVVPHFEGGRRRPDAERLFVSDFRQQRVPDGVFRFRQRLELRVGTDQVVPVGDPVTYEPFEVDHLVRTFVLGNDTMLQEQFLERTRHNYEDTRAMLLAE